MRSAPRRGPASGSLLKTGAIGTLPKVSAPGAVAERADGLSSPL